MAKHRLTLIIIAVLAIAIVAGGYFVGVKPQLDRIAAAEKQTTSMQQMNTVQQARNATLASENEKLDDYKNDLKAEQAQIPATRSQKALLDQIEAAADGANVTIQSVNFDEPILFAPPERVDVTSPSSGTLVAVPVSIAVTGARADSERFAARLQSEKRIITIYGSQFSDDDESPSFTVTGATWVLMPAQ